MGIAEYGLLGTFLLYPPRYLAEHPEVLAPKAVDLPEKFTETSRRRIEAILKFDSRPYLGKIRVPTLVIGAADDVLTPAYFSEELAQKIRGAELALLPYGGHYCPVTATEEYNARLLQFLSRLAAAK
jgi:aminoacrylate hydrolase